MSFLDNIDLKHMQMGGAIVTTLVIAGVIALVIILVKHFRHEKFSIVEGKKVNMTQLEISHNVEEYRQNYYLTQPQLEFLEKGGDYTDAEKALLTKRPTPVGSTIAHSVGSNVAGQPQPMQPMPQEIDGTPLLSSSLLSSLSILACCFILVSGISGIAKASATA